MGLYQSQLWYFIQDLLWYIILYDDLSFLCNIIQDINIKIHEWWNDTKYAK